MCLLHDTNIIFKLFISTRFYWVSLKKRLFTGSHWRRIFLLGLIKTDHLLGLTDKETVYWVPLKQRLLNYWVSQTMRLFTRSHYQETFYWVSLAKRLLLGFTSKETFYWVSLAKRLLLGFTSKETFFFTSKETHWQRDFYWVSLTMRFFTGSHWRRNFFTGSHRQRNFLQGLPETETFYWESLKQRLFAGSHWNSESFYRGNTTRLLSVPWDGWECHTASHVRQGNSPTLQDRLVQTLPHQRPSVSFYTYWLASSFPWIPSPYPLR